MAEKIRESRVVFSAGLLQMNFKILIIQKTVPFSESFNR